MLSDKKTKTERPQVEGAHYFSTQVYFREKATFMKCSTRSTTTNWSMKYMGIVIVYFNVIV